MLKLTSLIKGIPADYATTFLGSFRSFRDIPYLSPQPKRNMTFWEKNGGGLSKLDNCYKFTSEVCTDYMPFSILGIEQKHQRNTFSRWRFQQVRKYERQYMPMAYRNGIRKYYDILACHWWSTCSYSKCRLGISTIFWEVSFDMMCIGSAILPSSTQNFMGKAW